MDEAARTRLVAKRSPKERGVVARHVTTLMLSVSKWPRSIKVGEAVWLVKRMEKIVTVPCCSTANFEIGRYVQGQETGKE